MATPTRQSLATLARTAAAHQQRRLVHTHLHLSGSVFNTAARRRGQAQGLTATFGWGKGLSAQAAAGKVIAPRERKGYSTERAAPVQQESKVWDFERLSKLIEQKGHKIVLVDVREPGELQQTGKIPGAINVPITTSPDSFHISEEEFEDRFGYPRPSPDTEVVFYCKAGVRGRAAAKLAQDAGWKNVGEYPGSWLDWFEKGGKVER